MAWSGGNGRVLIDSNWISRVHTVLTAHGIVLFMLLLRLHLNWTQFGWFAYVTFFFLLNFAQKRRKKWVGSRFFLCNRRMNCSDSLCFFALLFSASSLPACGTVAKRLIWFLALLWLRFVFFFSAPNFLFYSPEHRRWPAICARFNKHHIVGVREREKSKANVKKYAMNYLFAQTNENRSWIASIPSIYEQKMN